MYKYMGALYEAYERGCLCVCGCMDVVVGCRTMSDESAACIVYGVVQYICSMSKWEGAWRAAEDGTLVCAWSAERAQANERNRAKTKTETEKAPLGQPR